MAGEDSFSFLPLLLADQRPVHEATVHSDFGGRFAIRSGKWKLILDDRKRGLYDLEVNPSEERNVIESFPAEAEKLRRLLEEIVSRGRSTAGQPSSNDGPPRWEQLFWMEVSNTEELSE